MKIKYAVINGIIHCLIAIFLLKLSFAKISFVDLLIPIVAFNFSTFVAISCYYKKNFSFFLMFTAVSSLTLFLSLLFLTVIFVFGRFDLIIGETDFFKDLYLITMHEDVFDLLRLLLIYLIFAIIPSFFVLRLGDAFFAKKAKSNKFLKFPRKRKKSRK